MCSGKTDVILLPQISSPGADRLQLKLHLSAALVWLMTLHKHLISPWQVAESALWRALRQSWWFTQKNKKTKTHFLTFCLIFMHSYLETLTCVNYSKLQWSLKQYFNVQCNTPSFIIISREVSNFFFFLNRSSQSAWCWEFKGKLLGV